VVKGITETIYCPTAIQLADGFTKALIHLLKGQVRSHKLVGLWIKGSVLYD